MNSNLFAPVSSGVACTNARAKFYTLADGTKILWNITIFPEPIFRRDGFELAETSRPRGAVPSEDEERQSEDVAAKQESQRKSYNRAKNKLFDILMSNTDIGHFVTLTFNSEFVDRYSYSDIVRKLSQWLDNRVRRCGLRYVLVPEFHKDGAVHFHGFMNAEVLKIEKARSPKTGRLLSAKGKQIYNVTDFTMGFTTAINIGEDINERIACAKYIYKYITKSHGKKVGGRYYLHGGALCEPSFEYADINYFDIREQAISLSYGGEFKRLAVQAPCERLVDFFRSVNNENGIS